MDNTPKPKKPIWKRWWFIALVLIIAIGAFAPSGDKPDDKAASNPPPTSSQPQTPAQTQPQAQTPPQTQTPTQTQTPAQTQPQPSTPTTQTQTPAVKTYKAGMYKIGTDMPPGEYTLIASGMAYFQISSDSTGSFASIVANDNFEGRSIVTVSAGQYLTLTRCTAYAVSDAPAVKLTNGILPQGMYRVGVDLAPGEYKASATSMGYIEVSKDSKHSISSIITNDNFEGDKYITVKEGQYLKLTRATLKVQ